MRISVIKTNLPWGRFFRFSRICNDQCEVYLSFHFAISLLVFSSFFTRVVFSFRIWPTGSNSFQIWPTPQCSGLPCSLNNLPSPLPSLFSANKLVEHNSAIFSSVSAFRLFIVQPLIFFSYYSSQSLI